MESVLDKGLFFILGKVKNMRNSLIAIGFGLMTSIASPAIAQEFTLTSTSISEGEQLSSDFVFQGFGCEGGNTAPDLAWSGAPEGTQSYAVTVYDPDAPTGSGWWHWFTFNIPADVSELPAGTEKV